MKLSWWRSSLGLLEEHSLSSDVWLCEQNRRQAAVSTSFPQASPQGSPRAARWPVHLTAKMQTPVDRYQTFHPELPGKALCITCTHQAFVSVYKLLDEEVEVRVRKLKSGGLCTRAR